MKPFNFKTFTQKQDVLVLLEYRCDNIPPRLVPVCQYQKVFDETIAIKCPELFEGIILTDGEVRDKNGSLIADLYMAHNAEICEDFIPNIPGNVSDEETVVDALFFDGMGIVTYKDESGNTHYLKFTYPTLEKCNASTKHREEINNYLHGGQKPEDFTITYSDSAMCFGKCTVITDSKYQKLLETIMEGKIERSRNASCNPKAPERLYEQILAEQSKGYKYLLIYRNQKELLERLDNKLYTISDTDGKYLCDLLKPEYDELADNLVILDRNSLDDDRECMSDWVLAEDACREEVISKRAAVILTEEEWITFL